jgi:opacity protein-like surface antigen
MSSRHLTFLFLALAAGPAVAGGPTAVSPEPVPVAQPPAPVHDWSGAYAGLSYGTTSARFAEQGDVIEFTDGTVAGVYGGYLVQRGSFVYGGELAYGAISDAFNPLAVIGSGTSFDRVFDLKARAGLSANRALFYGVLGYSQAHYTQEGDGDAVQVDSDGFLYGIGAEYAVSPRLTIGLEYLLRDLANEGAVDLDGDASVDLDTLSLRVGFTF